MNNMTDKELYDLAKKRVTAKKAFNTHLAIYIAVSILLIAISVSNESTWFIFPVLGWGIGVVAHRVSLNSLLNSNNDIEREFNELKRSMK